MNTNHILLAVESTATPARTRTFRSEPELNLRDPLLFQLDETENAEIGVRPAKMSLIRAQLRPRDRRTAGPAGWEDIRTLNAALDAHSNRVGWTPNPKGPGARWIRAGKYNAPIPFPAPADLEVAA